MANAERSIHTDDSQKKNTAEHVGVLEETIELAEKNSKRPVVKENAFGERNNSCQAEDQVRYGEIDQPNVCDSGFHAETGHPDDHRVPCGAEENDDGVEDNVHCRFLIVHRDF